MASYKISVRDLAEMYKKSGDIDSRYTARTRPLEGTRLHQFLQKRYTEADAPEVSVKIMLEGRDGLSLLVQGRIDGVLDFNGTPVIHEIKSTSRDVSDIKEPAQAHITQCRLYAYIYASQHALETIALKLTYVNTASRQTFDFEYTETTESLKAFFDEVTGFYLEFIYFKRELNRKRDMSVSALSFPFEYRRNQREIIKTVYGVIKTRKRLFINAPTATGKTVNALFPSVKLLPEMNDGKIFYLTSKSTQKEVAQNTLEILKQGGLFHKSVVITAKEKCCKLERPSCRPDMCEYAVNYYGKVRGVIEKLLSENDIINESVIERYVEEFKVCPFELSLDLSLWADVIVCDYNYAFDPQAALKRYFDAETGGDYVFLIDEAHNLSDRSRDMYSAVIDKTKILRLRREFSSNGALKKRLGEINKTLLALKKECGEGECVVKKEIDPSLVKAIYAFENEADKYLAKNSHDSSPQYRELYDAYFELHSFMNIYDIMGHSHSFIYNKDEDVLKLFCADAQEYLREALLKARSAVFFSATLTPLSYYCEILGGSREDMLLSVDSIFDKSKFKKIIHTGIKTTYARRADYYEDAAECINASVNHRNGNYLVYFPSYAYMKKVAEIYKEKYGEDSVLVQSREMSEAQRREFLANFEKKEAVTAFAVAGGVFSEAVDLTGEKLIGVVMCGVALPMVCTERELIRGHFDEEGKSGFDYAYVYPAMNKVLQAMGRVIRTTEDTGSAVLLDERFTMNSYKKCFPSHYDSFICVKNKEELEEALEGEL